MERFAMTDHDHDHSDTDLTDPHGEAEALRRENVRLRAHIQAMQGYVQEYLEPGPYVAKHGRAETFNEPHMHQHEDYAFYMRAKMREAVLNDLIHMLDGPEERAALSKPAAPAPRAEAEMRPDTALAASRAPDPVVNAGSCQPGDLISRAASCPYCGNMGQFNKTLHGFPVMHWVYCVQCGASASAYSKREDALAAWNTRALPAAPVAEAQCCMCGKTGLSTAEDGGPECQLSDGRWACSSGCYDRAVPQPTIGGAELDALVARLQGPAASRIGLLREAADAITALRAQPDWKAMAERLGEALEKQRKVTPKAMQFLMVQGRSGLLLADDLHKADDAARAALSDLAKMKGDNK